jgi:hypothetical protein
MSQLTASEKRGTMAISEILSDTLAKNPKMSSYFTNPGPEQDCLFSATYDHIKHQETCSMCDASQLVNRNSRPSGKPEIHHGVIASALAFQTSFLSSI